MINDSLFSSDQEDWNTPEWLVNLIRCFGNGVIDLDPCSNSNSLVKAKEEWTEGALQRSWRGYGLTFVNPPYGRGLIDWADHISRNWKVYLTDHVEDQLILLVPARTDTNWWHEAIKHASTILFFKGRLKFGKAVNSAPFPSALIHYGKASEKFKRIFGPLGWIVQL